MNENRCHSKQSELVSNFWLIPQTFLTLLIQPSYFNKYGVGEQYTHTHTHLPVPGSQDRPASQEDIPYDKCIEDAHPWG